MPIYCGESAGRISAGAPTPDPLNRLARRTLAPLYDRRQDEVKLNEVERMLIEPARRARYAA